MKKKILQLVTRISIVLLSVFIVFYTAFSIFESNINIFEWSGNGQKLLPINIIIWTYILVLNTFKEFKNEKF